MFLIIVFHICPIFMSDSCRVSGICSRTFRWWTHYSLLLHFEYRNSLIHSPYFKPFTTITLSLWHVFVLLTLFPNIGSTLLLWNSTVFQILASCILVQICIPDFKRQLACNFGMVENVWYFAFVYIHISVLVSNGFRPELASFVLWRKFQKPLTIFCPKRVIHKH